MNDKLKLILSGAVLIVIGLVIGYLIWGGSRNLGGTTAADWNVGGNLSVTGATSLTGALTAATSTLGGVGNNVIIASTTNAYNIGLILKGGGFQLKAKDSANCYTISVLTGSTAAPAFSAATTTCQ